MSDSAHGLAAESAQADVAIFQRRIQRADGTLPNQILNARQHPLLPPDSVTENPSSPASEPQPLPARISEDGRTATWNPGMTYAAQVRVRVRLADGATEERRSMNSGRARVREGETIEAILANDRL